jgi:ADP-ribose pyrophosphatase
VVLIPINAAGKVLLIRQFRQSAARILLEAPAGTREPGESPEATARRELQEEVGYKAGKLIPIGGSWVAPGYSTEYCHAFIAMQLEPDPTPADEGEDIVVAEFDFSDVHRLIVEGELEDQMTIAALLSAQHVYMDNIKSGPGETE